MNSAARLLLPVLCLLGMLLPARAATTCSINSLSGLSFVYDPSLVTPTDSTSTLSLTCARSGGPANITVTILAGASSTSGSVSTRKMRNAASGDLMNYNVYRDASRALILGQTSGVDSLSIAVSSIPNNGSKVATITLYGRLPALQAVDAGNYADSVLLTINP